MSMRSSALRTCGALSILLVAAACGDEVTTKPAVRQFAPSMSRDATPISGRHVFALNGTVPADFASRVAAAGGTVVRMIPAINVIVTEGLTDASASTLAGSNEVSPDVQTQWIPPSDSVQISSLALDTPADATSLLPPQGAIALSQQWNMFQIHAPEAWTNHTGIPSVRVAILDTGLDPDHIDQHGLIDQASSVAFVASTNGPPTWADDNFHGTHVGGIVTSNNIVVAGVAPNVTLIAVKVLNAAGEGSFANIIAGIVWATDVHAQVINMSIGADIPKQALDTLREQGRPLLSALNRAINYAKSHGVLVVSAAGNHAEDLQHAHAFISLPCEAGVQLCVSATGPGDVPASYTNYGTNAINVAAPGGEPPASYVLSLCSSHSTLFTVCKNRHTYLGVIGTSQAAPHVSGLAALLDSQFGGQLNPSQLITLIQQNADDLGKPGADPFFGKGRINVFKAVNTATP